MNEETFRRIIILFVILGLLILLIQTIFFQPKQTSVSEISISNNLEVISISGVIKNLNSEQGYISFDLCENQKCIKSILFNPNKTQIQIIESHNTNKETLNLTGKIEIYRDVAEIIIYTLR